MTYDYSGSNDAPAEDGEVPELSERFLAGMALSQTPEQQAIARQIYQRLEEGAEVDDIKPLIEHMMRIVVTQRNGGVVSSFDESEPDAASGVIGGTSRQQNAWGAGPGSGLGAPSGEERRGW